jgi:glycerol uptake facilitator-like aquaporin
METNNANYSEPAKRTPFYSALLYEFLGTALVTSAFNLGAKNAMVRAGAYLGAYLFASSVSGAHFNPATTVAVYLTEISAIVVQVMGAFLGTLIAFCALKDYFAGAGTNYLSYKTSSFSLFPVPVGFGVTNYYEGQYYYMDRTETEPSVYFMRVSMQEVLETFIFTFIFLALQYDGLYAKSSRVLKGIALYHVMFAVYVLSMGAGACLNPALAIA